MFLRLWAKKNQAKMKIKQTNDTKLYFTESGQFEANNIRMLTMARQIVYR